jgi:hypothetical protein
MVRFGRHVRSMEMVGERKAVSELPISAAVCCIRRGGDSSGPIHTGPNCPLAGMVNAARRWSVGVPMLALREA